MKILLVMQFHVPAISKILATPKKEKMAEAAVEDSATIRFFCHKCSTEITRVLEDYRCPTCHGGFIEELDLTNTSSYEPSEVHSDDEVEEFFSDVQNEFGHYFSGRDGTRGNQDRDSRNPDDETLEGDGTGRRYRNGTNLNFNIRPSVIAFIISLLSSNRARHNNNLFQNQYGRNEAFVIPTFQIIEDFYSLLGLEHIRGGNIFGRYNSIEQRIQDFVVNLTGIDWGPMGPGGRGNGPVFFLGNPGDYAWGRDGLDAIVTQFLNQMDGTGPPPLDKEKISEIPVTVIEQEQVDSNLQCSVCWDDFKVGERVRKLECEHFYHEYCIVPWLELHGTCPICRKSLVNEEEEKTPVNSGSNSSRSNLAAMFHAVQSRVSTNARSASSSSGNSTSTSNGRHPPPSDYEMDLEYDES